MHTQLSACFTCGAPLHLPKRNLLITASGQALNCCSQRCLAKIVLGSPAVQAVAKPGHNTHKSRKLRKYAQRCARARLAHGPPEVECGWGSLSSGVLSLLSRHLGVEDRLRAAAACSHWRKSLTDGVISVTLAMEMPDPDQEGPAPDCWSHLLQAVRTQLPEVRHCRVELERDRRFQRPPLAQIHTLTRWTELQSLDLHLVSTLDPTGDFQTPLDRLCIGALGRLTNLTHLGLYFDYDENELQLNGLSSLVNLQSLELLTRPFHLCYAPSNVQWDANETDLVALTQLCHLSLAPGLMAPATLARLTTLTRLDMPQADPWSILARGDDFWAEMCVAAAGLPALHTLTITMIANDPRDQLSYQTHHLMGVTCAQLAGLPHSVQLALTVKEDVCLDLDSSLLADLVGLPQLTHLDLSFTVGASASLYRLSDLTRLTHLAVRCGPLARPVITAEDIQQLGWGLRSLHTLHLSAPADCLTASALAEVSRLTALQHLTVEAVPFFREVAPDVAPVSEMAVAGQAEAVVQADQAATGPAQLQAVPHWVWALVPDGAEQEAAAAAELALAAAATEGDQAGASGVAPAASSARAASLDITRARSLWAELPAVTLVAHAASAAPGAVDAAADAAVLKAETPCLPVEPAAPSVLAGPPVPQLVLGPVFSSSWLPASLAALTLGYPAGVTCSMGLVSGSHLQRVTVTVASQVAARQCCQQLSRLEAVRPGLVSQVQCNELQY